MIPVAAQAKLVDVYVEQMLHESTDGWVDCREVEETVACLGLHKVRYVDAAVSRTGERVICHFLAPDIESVRHAMRGASIVANAIWAGNERSVNEVGLLATP